MRVDIWSDVVCPWCYVGKARFEKALSGFAHRDEVEVVYHSFELDPSFAAGQARETNLTDAQQEVRQVARRGASRWTARSASLARAEGLGFDSERPVGNTFDLHRVLHLGLAKGVQRELLARSTRPTSRRRGHVFDRDVLAEVAAGAGLDAGRGRQGPRRRRLRRRGTPGRGRRRSRSASAGSRSSCSTWRSGSPARSRPNCSPAHSTRPGKAGASTTPRANGEKARALMGKADVTERVRESP